MTWPTANWMTLLALLGSAGAGGVLSRLIARWLDHLRDKRNRPMMSQSPWFRL